MDLDEFKAHWNIIQDKEFQQQKISSEKLEQITMNATETLNQMLAKSIYWGKTGKISNKMFIGVLLAVLLITVCKDIYLHRLNDILSAIAYFVVLAAFSIVTIWVYKRQEQIFTLYNKENIKVTLQQTIAALKRFYLMFNIIYLLLFPAFFYAGIKLFVTYWHPSAKALFITCTLATVVSLIFNHWYYKVKFAKKIKSLETNLADLQESTG